MEEILLTRLSTFVKEIKCLSEQALNLCTTLDNNNLDNAKVVTAKLKSILSRFTSELYNYFNTCNNPNPDQISDFTTDQLQGEVVLAELETKIKLKSEETTKSSKENSQSSYSKLPDLTLPEFSGNVLEWHQFWDQFTSNINRRKLNDVDKLLYLKGSLKGDAARLVDGFDTTNKSYQIAVNALKTRYGKENDIIYAHHKALNNVKRAEKMEDCRGTLDEIERHLRVLQSMGENTSSNHVRFLLMEKFPSEIIYEVKMRLGSDGKETVEDIRRQLSIIISAKEESQRMTQEKTTSEAPQYTVETLHVKEKTQRREFRKNKPHNAKQRNHFTSPDNKPGTSHWTSRPNKNYTPMKRKFEPKKETNGRFYGQKKRKWSCIFCGENHYNVYCGKVKTIEERKAKLKNRCFNCFREGHFLQQCELKKFCYKCSSKGLRLRHHKALCPNNFTKREETERPSTSTSVMHVGMKGPTVLQTAVVMVKGENGRSKKCRILLDSGSQRSYVTRSIAEELRLKTEEENHLFIFTFGTKVPQELDSPIVKLNIETRTNNIKTLFANVVPSISHSVPYMNQKLNNWNHIENYVFADDGSLSDRVDILIGNDYYYSLMGMGKIQIKEDLYLVESELGWILSGVSRMTANKSCDDLSVVTYFQASCETRLNRPDAPIDNGNLKCLWDLESIGITDSPKMDRDVEAIKHFNETTENRDGRYYVSWPWNEYPPHIPSNFGLAFGRLVNLVKRLDADTLRKYDETLKDQLEKEIIEVVPITQANEESNPIHYLPHHGVSVPGKSLRIVYDASAKTKDNKSLNEHLHCGPMLLEDLTGLILKFRCYSIGITADVEKAFLQIGLKEQDRDVTRFLWLKNIHKAVNEDNLMYLRFTRVPFGIISSPFMLNATIKHHLSKAESEKVRKLANDIYVDNIVTGANNTQEALDLYSKSKETFQQISMNLREWSSNSEELMHSIPDAAPDKIVKVLGLDWNLEDDTLHLRTKVLNNANTKRGILKSIASIYDPCGYTVPTLLSAKLLLQDLWKTKIKWDTPLPQDIVDQWNEIKGNLDEVKETSLTRRYLKNSQNNDCQIHCFSDASTRAYSAVVYIVGKNEKSFVIGKSRLVPIKDQENLKIPRLELLGVLIGSRLIKYITKFIHFKITQQVLWTDSQIVIDWFNSSKLLTPFVARRLEEIKRNKDLIIRYVPSELNPADVATRPTSLKEDRQRWLTGPDYLLDEPGKWPVSTAREHTLLVGECLSKTEEAREDPEAIEKQSEKQEVIEPRDSTLKEIKKIQAEYFREEVDGKETNLSRNLGLFKDIDGILRCKGRLKYAEWSFDKRYPMIIPKDCDFTNKLIKDTHEKNYHVGANHTLSLIRQSYWIPQGKRYVQKILNKCPRCMKHKGGPFKLPPTPALPHERVNYSKPFTFTGVDYLGPVLVKSEKGTSKRWICLFTCLAVRAVHLEVVKDLSAEEGLLALRRMISTRGVPSLITSDNALHFKLIADIVKNAYCVENKIKWRFIPELAPWFGGYYERLVSLVKHCMRRTLQKQLLWDSQLSTITKEIESVINTRPLTCVDNELEHVLKPVDFLQVAGCISLKTANNQPILQGTSTKTNLIQGWRKARILLEEFKEMFQNRYLPSLRERYSHSHKQPRIMSRDIPKEGQIVQIKGDNKNREGWKVGKIIDLTKGSDGLVRVAKVKVGDTIFTRSIAHLYPLEVEDNEQQEPIPHNPTENVETPRLSEIVPEESVVSGDIEMNETDVPPMETLPDNEMEIDSSKGMTNDSTDSTTADIEIESKDKQDDLKNDTNIMNEDSLTNEGGRLETQTGHKRIAAVRALERIREWTRNLMTHLH
ncbi:uncharacterized protein isoform X2 [Choristoneura fumiferana]